MPGEEAINTEFWSSLVGETETTRPISVFAEAEIIIPNGPYAGQYYSLDTQPFIRLYYAAIDSRRYQRFAAVGPTQSGKTLSCSVIPTLWHVFEHRDDTIYGAPTIEIAKDKWNKDFSPVIRRTRYQRLMPTKGTGARGGTPTGIDFLNGASLRYMTGGGSDKSVAGYTARAINVTEVDGMDAVRGNSREADRISQLEVRGDAFGLSKRVYLECTASIEEGRIWREYLGGTHTVVEKPCPYCAAWVVPEREHCQGWQDCTTERQALESGHFVCPACAHPLTARDRVDMMHACRERVDNPDSLTYSFRWNAFDNLFWTPGEIALDQWRAAQSPDQESAEKVQAQFKWAVPYTPKPPPDVLTVDVLARAAYAYRRGIVPEWAEVITVGADVHKHVLYWCVVAWRKDSTGHVVDYGTSDCPSADQGPLRGIRIGLESMHEYIAHGWPVEGTGEVKGKTLGAIDAGYQQETVVEFCRQIGGYWPALGQGHTQTAYGTTARRLYSQPRGKSRQLDAGEQWHVTRFKNGVTVLHHNVDWEKLWVQKKLQQKPGEPGALTIFVVPDEREHTTFFKHLSAEQLVEEKGATKWETISRNNHYLDALCLATLAARKAGVTATPDQSVPAEPIRNPDVDAAVERLMGRRRR